MRGRNGGLTPDLVHQCLELVNVLKAAVDAGKANIRYLVELLEVLEILL
jgi:hypothetical protein